MYNSKAFSIFKLLCNNYLYQVPKYFCDPKGKCITIKWSLYFLSVCMHLFILDMSYQWNCTICDFCVWLHSFAIIFSKFTYVVAVHSFLWPNNTLLYGYTTCLSIHQSMAFRLFLPFSYCKCAAMDNHK